MKLNPSQAKRFRGATHRTEVVETLDTTVDLKRWSEEETTTKQVVESVRVHLELFASKLLRVRFDLQSDRGVLRVSASTTVRRKPQ